MSLDRRTLLLGMAAASPLAMAGRLWAAPAGGARLLVVFLRGAYDATNIVIPTRSDFYYESRPTLAIPRPDPANSHAALSLGDAWGLHPALRETILPLYQKGNVAFIPFAGTDDLTRSHFETQDTIELGQDINSSRNYRSGFMGRLAQTLSGTSPIAFTAQLPLIFQSTGAIPNIAINAVAKSAITERQVRLISEMYAGRPLASAVDEGFHVRDDVYHAITEKLTQASRGAASPKGFELSARRIGQLMRDRFSLGFVDVGGWDTHVNQGGATGYLADRIGELGRGLAGFSEEIGPQWDNTVVVVISEFGRTFRENGDKGTDHGHGSVYWVLGGGIKGGRLAGEQVPVDQQHLFQNRDYPVLTDYRAMFGGLFQRMYGLKQRHLQAIFPIVSPMDLKLV
ncbi:DUF1501 domain-containing protein [Acetobacter fabarum]|uniref:DUF1501 domain-containing protein n=1 Tax=Acetobacter fabarum TaxID=483199 RepID=UPI00312B4714